MAELHDNLIRLKEIIHTPDTHKWCRLPYPGHPKGCPNYRNKEGCPPNVKYITEILDFNKPFWIVYSEFDLIEHITKMKQKLPHWTERQLRCVLYWQNTARDRLRKIARIAQYETNTKVILFCPEAHGVNLYATCQRHGLTLEPIKGLKICRHIALMGHGNG